MDNIVDLTARRNRADQPDPEFVSRDFRSDRVDTMFLFTGNYQFDGEQWGVDVWARDFAEAERKLAAISGGKIDGQVMSRQPV